jgi:hypothetical protein
VCKASDSKLGEVRCLNLIRIRRVEVTSSVFQLELESAVVFVVTNAHKCSLNLKQVDNKHRDRKHSPLHVLYICCGKDCRDRSRYSLLYVKLSEKLQGQNMRTIF